MDDKLVMQATLKDVTISKGLIRLKFSMEASEITNYIQTVRTVGGKTVKVAAKTDSNKFSLGEYICRSLNIDLRDGDAVLMVEGDFDDFKAEISDIKSIEGKVSTICIKVKEAE